jgi:branched-chain amino acid transport system substrate-binding protein
VRAAPTRNGAAPPIGSRDCAGPPPSGLIAAMKAAPLRLAAAALLVAACRDPEPLRVGFLGGLSGRNHDLGVSARDGAQLAFEELDAAGGVRGRPLELVVIDDAQDPEAARRGAEQLVASPVVAVIGPVTSGMAEVVLPVFDRAGLLAVSPTVTSTAFAGRDDQLVLLYSTTAEAARALAGHLGRTGRARRVAVVLDEGNRAFTTSWLEHFRAAQEGRGGAVVSVTAFRSGEGRLGEVAERALRAPGAPPDGVLILANAVDCAALAQQLRKRSPGVLLLGTDWGFTQALEAEGGAAVEGALFVQKVDLLDRGPAFAAFRDRYRARFGRAPDFAAVTAYEAAGVLAAALRDAPTREGVRAALLRRGTFPGLQAELRVDANGDVARDHRVMTIRGGAMVHVE